jgi:methanogenic corrinoid protein MtbC1
MEVDIQDKRHPIEVASRRTGLTKDLLRAWERRYAAVEPSRTDSGRRLYSDEDIERLRNLRLVTSAGRAIGQVAGLPLDELAAMVIEDADQHPDPVSTGAGKPGDEADLFRTAREAVLALDSTRLRRALHRAMLLLSPSDVIDGVLSPLMKEVGEMWADGRLSVAHEHAATTVLRVTIAEAVETMENERPGAPRVLVATPAGQRHDLGALLVAATASSSGCRVTFLGADLPAEDIAIAARTEGVDLVALSIVHPADDPGLPAELERLRRELPSDIPIIAGGRASASYRAMYGNGGVRWMNSLAELRDLLGELSTAGT